MVDCKDPELGLYLLCWGGLLRWASEEQQGELRGTVTGAGWCSAGFSVLGKPSRVSRTLSVGSEQVRDSLT